jgi:hypothetical protein
LLGWNVPHHYLSRPRLELQQWRQSGGKAFRLIRNHITRVFEKLGVHSRAQAIVLARDKRLSAEAKPTPEVACRDTPSKWRLGRKGNLFLTDW